MSLEHRLEDLAVVYVGLALGTDGRMHFNEFSQIADLLIRWRRPDDPTNVLDLVQEAVSASSRSDVEEAVDRLSGILSSREKRAVMEDLSEIALADRRFLREEAEYIVSVARKWEITESGAGAFSSVLRAAWAAL